MKFTVHYSTATYWCPIVDSFISWVTGIQFTPCFLWQFLLYQYSCFPCGRLSWLPVSFLLHVKHTLSYRIVFLSYHPGRCSIDATNSAEASSVWAHCTCHWNGKKWWGVYLGLSGMLLLPILLAVCVYCVWKRGTEESCAHCLMT